MTEPMPAELLRTPRLRALDGLRLLAALAVIAHHFTGRDTVGWGHPTKDVWPALAPFTQYGFAGVELFFMISGFVVLMSAEGRSVPQFAASRIARLYPTYWLVLAGVIALQIVVPPPAGSDGFTPLSLSDRLANFTMLQNAVGVPSLIQPAWTLYYEALFYMMLAILIAVGITRNRVLLFGFLWPVIGFIAQTTGFGFGAALLGDGYAPFFSIGMMLFLIYQYGWSAPPVLVLALNIGFSAHFANVYAQSWNAQDGGTGANGYHMSGAVITVLFLLMIVAILAVTTTRIANVNWKWLTVAGAITYPLYLIHENVGWALIRSFRHVLPNWANLVVVVVILIALAYLIQRFFERPVMPRLRKAIQRALSHPINKPVE